MRALAIGLLAAALFAALPNPALAANHTTHRRHHTAQRHHWFWQHWHVHQWHLLHHKSKSK
jgi:hypothetical protein